MEQMPYRPELETAPVPVTPALAPRRPADWQAGLPMLVGSQLTLRELQVTDAPALFAALTTEQVSRFISPPPSSVEGFERFIAWTHRQRDAGQYVCFAIVPNGSDRAVGIFQVRSLEPAFATAEWGFALAAEFWGTGLFMDGASLVVTFAFEVLGVHRLEARAAVQNGRGNGALRKLGAVQEGLLRRSFRRNDKYFDQVLWTLLRDEWLDAKAVWSARIIH